MKYVDLKIVREIVMAFYSNDQEVLKQHPVATATGSRFLMNGVVNSIMPTILMGFLNEKYPNAAKDMQSYLQPVQVYMAMVNIIGVAALITALEYAGRKWTGNLLTGNNLRKDAMIGLSFSMFMQTFASTEHGKVSALGDFWNKLTEYNPVLSGLVLSLFIVPAVTKSVVALGKRAINGPVQSEGAVALEDAGETTGCLAAVQEKLSAIKARMFPVASQGVSLNDEESGLLPSVPGQGK